MGYRLAMSVEISDWLAELRRADPRAAIALGQALAALIDEGANVGPPLVVPLADLSLPADLGEALDQVYEDRLERLTEVRRALADAAMLASDIELEIGELDSRHETAKAAELRRILPGVRQAEGQLNGSVQRMQSEISAYRARKEVLKARFVAAVAMRSAGEAMSAMSGAGTQDGVPGSADRGAGVPYAWADGGDGGDGGDDKGAGNGARYGAHAAELGTDQLRDIADEIQQELSRESRADGLLELRPGTLAGADAADIRVLFAVEPPGTALLIAVVHGRDAVLDNRGEAAKVSASVLRRVRAGKDPDAAAVSFDDQESFAGEFFPDQAPEIRTGAVGMIARSRARLLIDQRTRLGLTQAQVAQRMGVQGDRVATIETAVPGGLEIRELASYVEALGGRLDVVADFGGERVVLR